MSYRTQSAETLMDVLHTQEAMYAERVQKAKDAFERGLYQGWLDATKLMIEYAPKHLENVEAEAELVPVPDLDFASAAEWLRNEMAT